MLQFLPPDRPNGTLISLNHVQQLWEAFVVRTTASIKHPESAEIHLENVMQFLSIVMNDRAISVDACQFALERYNAGDVPFDELAHYHYRCFADLHELAQDMGSEGTAGIATFWKIAIYSAEAEVWRGAAQYLSLIHI